MITILFMAVPNARFSFDPTQPLLSHWPTGCFLSCPRQPSLEQHSGSGRACRHRTTLVNVGRHADSCWSTQGGTFTASVRTLLVSIKRNIFLLLTVIHKKFHVRISRKNKLSFNTKHALLLQYHSVAMAV